MLVTGALTAVVLAITACGGGSGSTNDYVAYEVEPLRADDIPAAMKPAEVRDVAGREFGLVAVEGANLPPGVEFRLAFTKRSIEPSVGCNTGYVSYTLERGVLTTQKAASTAAGCHADRMRGERWLERLTDRRADVKTKGQILMLESGSVTALFEQISRDAAILERSSWTDGTITLLFRDGTYQVSGPCGRGGGSAHIGDGSIMFGDSGSADPCGPGDEAASEVIDLLEGAVDYNLEGRTLTLGDQESEVVLEAEDRSL